MTRIKGFILHILCNPSCFLILNWIFVLTFCTKVFSFSLNKSLVFLFLYYLIADRDRTECKIFQMLLKCNKFFKNVFQNLFCLQLPSCFLIKFWGRLITQVLTVMMQYLNLSRTACKHLSVTLFRNEKLLI